jgi:hypothetical protein
MTDNEVPPPEEDDFPKWFDDQRAKKEDKNWDQEGKLRGQEEANHLWWLRAYGALIIFFLSFSQLFFSPRWRHGPLTTYYQSIGIG